jgi:hypothetical protein
MKDTSFFVPYIIYNIIKKVVVVMVVGTVEKGKRGSSKPRMEGVEKVVG